jgi:hypothetical protein
MVPFRLLLLAGLLLSVTAQSAYALRCGNRLVSPGETDFQVRATCGNPYWIEEHYQVIVSGDENVEIAQPVEYSAWFFNFGANRFLVRLLFRDGHLVREESLGRGIDELGTSCDLARVRNGMSSGELIAYCGEPGSRRVRPTFVSRRVGPRLYDQSESYREDWTYDSGDEYLYVVHIANGHVEGIEHLVR